MINEKTNYIPTVETDIFERDTESKFALVELSPEDIAEMSEFRGAAELRANTYMRSGYIKESELNDDGTELDPNDKRSAHFVLFERTAVDSLARVVGNMRLVIKDSEHDEPLPVEEFFPDYFQEQAPLQSAEVSRLISRHEDPVTQTMIKWPMFIAGYKYVEKNSNGPVYGLLTPGLTSQLIKHGVPLRTLQEARYIEEINATKQPVEIMLPALGELIEATGDYGIEASLGRVSYLNLHITNKG